jgi:hypothetical protein
MAKKKKELKKSKKAASKTAKKPVEITKPRYREKKPVKKKAVAKKGKKKKEDLMCFLTTACVHYYSLADNGYELTTLRHYRDTWLASSVGGKKLIAHYYEVSPKIVELVNKDKDKTSVYGFIYSQVKAACIEIEKREFNSAKKVYVALVKTLMNRYSLN